MDKSFREKLFKYGLILLGLTAAAVVKTECINKGKWEKMTTELMKNNDSLFENDSSRLLFSNCIIDKYKTKYPDGPSGIAQDSLNKDAGIFGAECGSELKGKIKFKTSWTPDFTTKMKKYLLETPVISNLPDNLKSPFCDCFITKLKQIYPTGLHEQIPEKIEDTILYFCKQEIRK